MINQEDYRNKIFKEKEKILLISISLLIFAIHIMHINKLGIFYVLNDEFGYWSNAAYLAGYDWSSATSNIFYYSYGYSILLVPLFWIFDNPIYMYRAAIALNAIMMSGSFLLCYDMAKKLARDINKYLLMAISFVIAMYPAYIVQTNVAWSECTLIFVCWLIAWCYIGLDNKTSLIKFGLLGFLSVYVYIIHQRTLGILVTSLIVILLMKLYKKINWKQFASFIIVYVILLVIHGYIKSDIQTNNYLLSTALNANDFAGQVGKIKALFTLDGFINFINIFLSQFFYAGAASFLLCYIGIFEILTNFKKDIILSAKNNRKDVINSDVKIYLYVFLFLAFFSTLTISAVFMSKPDGIDHIIYGRYTELILGPIILLGFINFLGKNKINLKDFVSIIISFLFITIITNLVLRWYGFNNYNTICAIGMIFKPSLTNGYNVFFSALIAILLCSYIYISFHVLNKSKHLLSVGLICIAGIFFVIGESFVILGIIENRDYGIEKNKENLKIADYITKYDDDLPIYFLLSSDFYNNRSKDFYQFLLKDKKLICVTKEQLNFAKEDKYVISGGFNNNLFELSNEYDFLLNAADSYLFMSKANGDTKNVTNFNEYNGISIPLGTFQVSNVKNEDIIQSNGTEGFFMYGPYINLNSGSYIFTIEVELFKTTEKNVGYIDIVSNIGNNQHFKQEINIDDFDVDNKLVLHAPFELNTDTDNIELRAYAYEGVQIKINNIYIKN